MKDKFNYLKTFESFTSSPQTKPSRRPSPAQPTIHPGTRPSTRPTRKSPIRRHSPAVDPAPKAEVEDVIELAELSMNKEQKKQLRDHYAKRNK